MAADCRLQAHLRQRKQLSASASSRDSLSLSETMNKHLRFSGSNFRQRSYSHSGGRLAKSAQIRRSVSCSAQEIKLNDSTRSVSQLSRQRTATPIGWNRSVLF